jgi:alkaline phosphatase D
MAPSARLAAGGSFRRLRETSRVFAVWDDHDYGRNDAGREFPIREQSQSIFLDFWEVSENDPRRERPGIYHEELFDLGGTRVQLILLDTRYFRTDIARAQDPPAEKGPYGRTQAEEATILGAAQWSRLEDAMGRSADLRIIASSITASSRGAISLGSSIDSSNSWETPEQRPPSS